MAGERVLIVEDSSVLSSVMKLNLEMAGFVVSEASNGLAAWELSQSEPPDLVITDYQMPEMDGVQLRQAMLADEKLSRIPVFLVTARGLELQINELREQYGVTEVFLKPFSPMEIVAAVKQQLRATAEI